jgi:predicted esterase
MRKRLPEPASITVSFPVQYELRMPENNKPDGVALLIHGFLETGKISFSKLENVIPSNYAVLAPSALFPVPRWKGDHYIPAYSWYFYDPNLDTYIIDMKPASEYVAEIIGRLKFEIVPKIIIGFSQGGYFAGHLGEVPKNVKQIIGVGCQFLDEELPREIPFRMDQVFGGEDRIVSLARAEKAFKELQKRGVKGEFHLIPGVAHEINEAVATKVGELVTKGIG